MMNAYIKIARIDHWIKNIFMLPGFVLAVTLSNASLVTHLPAILIALLSTCFVASANYVINEYLDAEFDRYHPVKKNRASAAGQIKPQFMFIEYLIFIALGLGLASFLTRDFVIYSMVLLLMGVIYNVQPLRSKDRVYLDVLSESINNPLRLMLGWSALVSGSMLPSSILVAYWMGGAFLMAVKRYAEYRFIGNPAQAGLYRRSFQFYTEQTLLLSSFFYAIASAFFLAIFLIKYRIELLLSFPLFSLLFVWYLAMAMRDGSAAQNPELLYKEKNFMAYVVSLGLAIIVLLSVDLPWLKLFTEPLKY
ncbi:UbiA prenyltransferase family protein [Methylomagnum sp.]